jgi:hypothetical protein
MLAMIRPRYLYVALEASKAGSEIVVLFDRTDITIKKGIINNKLRRFVRCLPPMS